MRTNLNSTSMRNTCPKFPLFGANYPDATCIDGILYDLDNVGDDGVLIKPLEEIPCPFCRTEEFIRYDPFNKEYSMDSEEDIRDWYMSYINEGNYIPVYTSLPITITNNHKLYKYYIC